MRSDLITTSMEVAHLSKVVRGLRPRADAAIAARDRAALGAVLDDAESILHRAPQLQKLAQVGSKAYDATMALCAHRARGNIAGIRAATQVLGGTIAQWQKLTAPRPVSLGDLSDLKRRRRSNDLYATINAADMSLKKAARALPSVVRSLNGLGAASYAVVGKDCPVNEADWDGWCNCMYSGEENVRCKWRVSLGCPGCAFAPWTDVGAGARSIRKENGGLLYTASTLTAVPTPAEFEPDRMFRTSVENWPRFAVLVGYLAGLTSFANPVVALAATIGVGVNPMAAVTFWTTAPAIAIPYALVRGQGRLEENVLGPLASLGGDVLKSVLQSLSGEPKAAAVAFFARRAAKTLESYPDDFSKSLGVFLRSISETATDFIAIAQDPKKELGNSGVWSKIGQKVSEIGRSPAVSNNAVGGLTTLIGETMHLLSESLAALVNGNAEMALNKSTTNLLGADLNVLMKGGPALTNALSQENNAMGKLANLEGGVLRLVKALEQLTNEMKGVPLFGDAITLITQLINAVRSIFDWIKTFLENAKKAPNQLQKMNPAATPPKPKPSAGGIVAGATGGALIGAKFAAVPGALVGGTVGAVVAALTVKKPAPIVAPPMLTTARVTTTAARQKIGISTITNRRA